MLSAGFVTVVIAAFALPSVVHGQWAGVHLALAGAAKVPIGTFMPHSGATLAGSIAGPASLRLGGVLDLAAGAALVVVSRAVGVTVSGGAGLLWLGLTITALGDASPDRRAATMRRSASSRTQRLLLVHGS